MIPCRPRGFTLIEMLIIVAVLAIAAGGMMGLIVAPIQEQVIADREASWEAGAAVLAARVVRDAHGASAVGTTEDGGLWLDTAAGRVVYTLNGDLVQRRVGNAAAATLLDGVATLEAAPLADGRWSLRLEGATNRAHRPMTINREFVFLPGLARRPLEAAP
jgi:prepilin-type N-terminal cleavage/methylation domain-containing protein